MSGFKKTKLYAAISVAAILGACSGSTEVASPGEGPFLPAPGTGGGGGGGGGTPPPGTPASSCPAGTNAVGFVANNTLLDCQIPNLILGNFELQKVPGVAYSVSGRVDVGIDRGGDGFNPVGQAGVLTIRAGVKVFGSNGLDYIVVNRGSQIFAVGTETDPVIMTSRKNMEGQATEDSIGDWGGLVILGRANTSNCPGATPAAIYGTSECQSQVEGTSAFYGGNLNNDNSGVLRYFRLMYSGFQILPNNELNGITFAGVGTGTTLEYIQVHNSSDDGVEFFGGSVNLKHLVLTGNDDDSIDTDQGYDGAIQFAIVAQRPGGADRILEASMAALGTGNKRSRPVLANFTLVGNGPLSTGSGIMTLNTGTDYRLYNGVVTSNAAAKPCLDMDNLPSTTAIFRSVFMTCAVSFDADADDESAVFGAGTNNNTAGGVSNLTGNRINGNNESNVPVTTYASLSNTELPVAIKSFLTQTDYIGAVKDANDNWYVGWTCSPLIGQPTC